ncbi:nitrate- and nitrite sensing domain-containing protein [Streptomyces sp. CA-111067]|uniref:sensor histidine kinase n=1 Tax=Streptomyces sp. CA-111067 TaxID=3240046 RepID=UPI003D96534A
MDARNTAAASRRALGALGTTMTAPRTIRAKLARILVVSLALVMALLGTAVSRQLTNHHNASDTAANARLSGTLQGLIHELQKERGLTTGLVGGVTEFRPKLAAQRAATDTARRALDAELSGRTDPAAGSVRKDIGALDGLRDVRQAATDGTGTVNDTFDYFTTTITGLGRLGLGLSQVHDQQLRADYQALQTLGDAKEYMGEERAIVLGVLRAGAFGGGTPYSRFMEIRAGRLAGQSTFPRWATPAQQQRLDAAFATPVARKAIGYEQLVVGGGGRVDDRRVPPMAWYDAMTGTINGLRGVQISLGQDIQRRADHLESDATRQLTLYLLLALGGIAALAALAVGCVRAVSGPLASLTRQARQAADERLPAAVAQAQAADGGRPERPSPVQVPGRAGEEVKLVAAAFDRVQTAAFDLATEQAVLRRNATESLVNLGRRNQNLVRRQISFINKLEHEDADPATLANLFELDHLATRMRRNAESLLVLAGESSPRPWATPLSVTDVVRAALSEVEEYRRVALRRLDPVLISGSVVSEIAHLLAELVENALSYSPPDAEVEIEGRRTGAGYLVAIVDHGYGMDARGLAEANVRLSGTASFMAEPTRFLGHFVVGALARKCGIEVRLGEAPAAGVVARVLIPTTLLTEGETVAVGAAKDPGSEPAARRQGVAAPAAERVAAGGPASVTAAATGSAALTGPVLAAAEPGSGPVPGPVTPVPGSVPGPATAVAEAGGPRAAVPGPRRDEPDRREASSAARTRNGLVKRPGRSSIPAAVNETGAVRWQSTAEPTPDRSPDEVSGMLASLRSAHIRGVVSVEKEKKAAGSGPADRPADRSSDRGADRSSDRAAADTTEKGGDA